MLSPSDRETAIEYYRNVFVVKWGETTFSKVIGPIVQSAIEYEALHQKREERHSKQPWLSFTEKLDEPYQLIIETQIGLILVLCQTYITKVYEQLSGLHNQYELIFNKVAPVELPSKVHLMSNFGSYISGTSKRAVEGINALANYFKHHEEWPSNKPMKGKDKITAEIVSAIGVDLTKAMWYGQNLSRSIKNMGVQRMENLTVLPTLIDDWKMQIGATYSEDLNLMNLTGRS